MSLVRKVTEFIKNIGKEKREPWQIAAGRFFVEKSETGFTAQEYKAFILANYKVNETHLEYFWQETIFHPTGRQYSRNHVNGNWIPPIELVSMITDYDELVEARKNAKQAFRLSITAIIISLLSLIKN